MSPQNHKITSKFTHGDVRLKSGSLFTDLCAKFSGVSKSSVVSLSSTITPEKLKDNRPIAANNDHEILALLQEEKDLKYKLNKVQNALKQKTSLVKSSTVKNLPEVGPLRADFDVISNRLISLLCEKNSGPDSDENSLNSTQVSVIQTCKPVSETAAAHISEPRLPLLFSANDLLSARDSLETRARSYPRAHFKDQHSEMMSFLVQSMNDKFKNTRSPK